MTGHRTRTPRSKRLLGPALLALGLGACARTCERPRERPTRYLPADAPAVLELADLGLLAENKEELARAVAGLVTKEQLDALLKDLALVSGLDLSTVAGLEEAGLPPHGPVAAALAPGGGGAWWVVPVKDEGRFSALVERVARARVQVDSKQEERIGDRPAKVLLGALGGEKLPVAAWTFLQGLAIIAAGPQARELLERALATGAAQPAADVSTHPEYLALSKGTALPWDLRVVLPATPGTLAGTLAQAARLVGLNPGGAPELVPELAGTKSAALALDLSRRGLALEGRVRLDEAAQERARRMLAVSAEAPSGVRAVASAGGVVHLFAAGDPQALLEVAAPPGSPLRARLDQGFARVKEDLATDVERELLPALSGRVGVALGVEPLAGVDLRAVLQNPARAVWTAIALGAADPERIFAVEQRMEPGLVQRGLKTGTRQVKDRPVWIVGKEDGGRLAPLVETLSLPGARLFSNSGAVTDRLASSAADAPPDPLAGQGGLFLELRPRALGDALAAVDPSSLPLLMRAFAGKLTLALRSVDRVHLRSELAADGLSLRGQLALAGAAP